MDRQITAKPPVSPLCGDGQAPKTSQVKFSPLKILERPGALAFLFANGTGSFFPSTRTSGHPTCSGCSRFVLNFAGESSADGRPPAVLMNRGAIPHTTWISQGLADLVQALGK